MTLESRSRRSVSCSAAVTTRAARHADAGASRSARSRALRGWRLPPASGCRLARAVAGGCRSRRRRRNRRSSSGLIGLSRSPRSSPRWLPRACSWSPASRGRRRAVRRAPRRTRRARAPFAAALPACSSRSPPSSGVAAPSPARSTAWRLRQRRGADDLAACARPHRASASVSPTRSRRGPWSTTCRAFAPAAGALAVAARWEGERPTRSTVSRRRSAHRLDAPAEARALSTQARLSAVVVGAAPLGYLAFASSGRPAVRRPRSSAPASDACCLVVGLALEGLAALWIRRIVRSEAVR